MSYGKMVTANIERAQMRKCKECGGCDRQDGPLKVEERNHPTFPFIVRNKCTTLEFRTRAMAENYIDLQ